ncbi:MAG: N-acetyltransferase family protein [Rubrivivax sp.]
MSISTFSPASLTWPSLTVRPGHEADIDAVTAIYAHAVRYGTSSFEIVAPDAMEMARRRSDVIGKGWPWLVAENQGGILGYAYANAFRPRPAYRFTVEDSIYLHADAQGQGVGKALLAELMARCADAGARQMLAVIGDSNSLGSIALHRALGFEPAGLFNAVGWKFGRWLDMVMMQRALGPQGALPPPGGLG